MIITKTQLRQLIKEELKEAWIDVLDPESDIAPHKHGGTEADVTPNPEVDAEFINWAKDHGIPVHGDPVVLGSS